MKEPLSSITLRTYWMGGIEGAETDWNHPDNWSTREVPSSISDVIIPNVEKDGRPFPVILSSVRTVAHLEICQQARLTLEKGAILSIDGNRTYENGVTIYGSLINKGSLNIINPGRNCVELENGSFINYGILSTDFIQEEAINACPNSKFEQKGQYLILGVTSPIRSYSIENG